MAPLYEEPTEIENNCNLIKMIWYPGDDKEKKVVIANDQFKLRIVNFADKPEIVKTALGPCFGAPIANMKNLLGKEKDKRLIAFTTQEKIMGLMLLPLDGNPYRYMGVIAHPGIIKEMKPAANSNYIFTTGGKDFTINIWRYDSAPMIEAVHSGGEGIDPFLELLEGGKNGAKYKEMVDFFYYAQIKSNENSTKHRVLTQTVSYSHIKGLLASLGYYPTEKDVERIINEVKHSKKTEAKGEKNVDIDNYSAYWAISKIFDNIMWGYGEGLTDYEFEFNSNIPDDKLRTAHFDGESVVYMLLGSPESIVNIYNGELYRRNFYFSINDRMEGCQDNAFNLVHGWNLTEISEEVDYSEYITELEAEDNFGQFLQVSRVPDGSFPHQVKKYLKLSYSTEEEAQNFRTPYGIDEVKESTFSLRRGPSLSSSS